MYVCSNEINLFFILLKLFLYYYNYFDGIELHLKEWGYSNIRNLYVSNKKPMFFVNFVNFHTSLTLTHHVYQKYVLSSKVRRLEIAATKRFHSKQSI